MHHEFKTIESATNGANIEKMFFHYLTKKTDFQESERPFYLTLGRLVDFLAEIYQGYRNGKYDSGGEHKDELNYSLENEILNGPSEAIVTLLGENEAKLKLTNVKRLDERKDDPRQIRYSVIKIDYTGQEDLPSSIIIERKTSDDYPSQFSITIVGNNLDESKLKETIERKLFLGTLPHLLQNATKDPI